MKKAAGRYAGTREFIADVLVPCPACKGQGESWHRGDGGYDYTTSCWLCGLIHEPAFVLHWLPEEGAFLEREATWAKTPTWRAEDYAKDPQAAYEKYNGKTLRDDLLERGMLTP